MATFGTLEQQKRELLDELSQWAPQRLVFQPSAAEWSALQMLDHIIRTEREILLVAYSNENRPHHLGVTDRLRNRFLQAVFRSDRRVKVPASASLILPGEDLELAALAADWHGIRATLAEKLDRLLAISSRHALFHHPVGGWMSMPAVLDFLSVHLLHHGFQLQRLRTASEHL